MPWSSKWSLFFWQSIMNHEFILDGTSAICWKILREAFQNKARQRLGAPT
jgi:hypothetical protein